MKCIPFFLFLFSLILLTREASADNMFLHMDSENIYVGEEAVFTVKKTAGGSDEEIKLLLPAEVKVDMEKTEENLAEGIVLSSQPEENIISISYRADVPELKADFYISAEKEGVYEITAESSDEVSETLVFTVQAAAEEEIVSEEAETGEEVDPEEAGAGEEETGEEETGEEETTGKETDSQETNSGEEPKPTEGAARGSLLRAAGSTVDINTQEEYVAAFANPAVEVLNIQKDFTVTSNLDLNNMNEYRDKRIVGNGHTIDHGSKYFWYLRTTTNNPVTITVENLKLKSTSDTGPWYLGGLNRTARIIFDGVTFEGKCLAISGAATSPLVVQFRGQNTLTQTLTGKPLIRAAELIVQEDARVEAIGAGGSNFFEIANIGRSGGVGDCYLRKNSYVRLSSSTTGENRGIFNILLGRYVTLHIDGNLYIEDDATLHIDSKSGGDSTNRIMPAMYLEDSSKIQVDSGAKINIDIDGISNGEGWGVVKVDDSAQFLVKDGGALNMNLKNSGGSTEDAIIVGNGSKFVIGRNGIFDIAVSSGSGNRMLLNIGSNSTFQFADAKRVNLQMNSISTNRRLISMSSGKLIVDVQKVNAWSSDASWSDGSDDGWTYEWTPMYAVQAIYSGSNVTSVQASSIAEEVWKSFRDHFRTQNFKRVLFEQIEDVEIQLDELTNNHGAANSHTITGTATPGAYIRFTGNDHIPTGKIASPTQMDTPDNTVYHVNADASGHFSFQLEDGYYFNAGEVITGYAFLNGKTAESSVFVPQGKPTLNELTTLSTEFIGFGEAGSVVEIYLVNPDGDADIPVPITTEITAGSDGKYSAPVPAGWVLAQGTQYYTITKMLYIHPVAGEVWLSSAPSELVTVTEGGTLSFRIPEILSFGDDNALPYKSERVYRKVTDWGITVTDTHAAKQNWTIRVSLDEDFKTESGALLEDLLVFAEDSSEASETTVTSNMLIAEGPLANNQTEKTISWGAEEGFLLRLEPGIAQADDYEATLLWTIGLTP